MSQANLTPKEQAITDYLSDNPSTYHELSNTFGFGESTARDHISGIEQCGISVGKRRIDGGKVELYLRESEGEHPTTASSQAPTFGSHGKAQKTKRLNKHAQELVDYLYKELSDTPPAVSDVPLSSGGEEDVVIHVTDDHIGDKLEDEFGNVVFDTEIAKHRIKHRVNETFRFIERQKEAGYDFHTGHYVMGGDIVTGSGIYQGQSWEVELNLNEQIEVATESHYEQIKRLADEFEAVQVVCQTGNHGEIRISGSSQKANADEVVFGNLDLLVRSNPELDNVTFIRNDSTNFTNFTVRGHKAHLRHGRQAKPQSETSAAKRDFRGWKGMHKNPDLMYLGHYHIQGVERILGDTILIRSGSIKPSDDFEESLSLWSMPAATIHGVSDDRAKTWQFDVEFAPQSKD